MRILRVATPPERPLSLVGRRPAQRPNDPRADEVMKSRRFMPRICTRRSFLANRSTRSELGHPEAKPKGSHPYPPHEILRPRRGLRMTDVFWAYSPVAVVYDNFGPAQGDDRAAGSVQLPMTSTAR